MTTSVDVAEHLPMGTIANKLRAIFACIMPSGLTFTSGTGAPAATATKGSLYVDVATGFLYSNTSGATTWAKVSAT